MFSSFVIVVVGLVVEDMGIVIVADGGLKLLPLAGDLVQNLGPEIVPALR